MIAWGIARRDEAWGYLLGTAADIALLSEAAVPPAEGASRVDVDPAPWRTDGAGLNRPWRAAVVKLSVSRPGTLSAAIVTPGVGDPFVVASMYAAWERSHATTGSGWIYADGSAHRLISDLSVLVGQQVGHRRMLAAGDLSILHGCGEHGSPYWASRFTTVFARMAALGLSFVGPQVPAGRRADPWPDELPIGSRSVPTYHTSHQTPASATRQLDFVFASAGLVERVRVSARNEPDDWGPSDHCRVEIEVE